jgi:hypothetical protein
LEFPFWKLLLLIVSAFKGVVFSETPIHPPLGDILGPFTLPCPHQAAKEGRGERHRGKWSHLTGALCHHGGGTGAEDAATRGAVVVFLHGNNTPSFRATEAPRSGARHRCMRVRGEEEGSSWRRGCFRCTVNQRKEEEGGRSPPRAEPAVHRPLECVHRRPPAMDHGPVRA